MNLKQLFLEDKSSLVIDTLKQAKWQMRALETLSSFDVSHPEAMISYLKQNNVRKVDSTNFMVFTDISRYNDNSEFVEPLRQVYYPDIDVPKVATGAEFHTDDEFEEEEMLLGFEFVATGASGEMMIEGMASLADKNDEMVLAPPIRKWIYDKYIETLNTMSVLLSRS